MVKTNVIVILAIALLAGASTSIAAQSSDGTTRFEDIEGLQKVYTRQFVPERSSMVDIATPNADPGGWIVLSAVVLEFDTDDHASAGLEVLLSEIMASDLAGKDGQMEDAELDVDIEHVAKRDVVEASGLTRAKTTVLVAAAQDDRYAYLVVGLTFGVDPSPVVASTLTGIADADISDDAESFREDGTSEGGLWAKFPSLAIVQADVPALVNVSDEMTWPVSSISTPARVMSTPAVLSTPSG